MASDTVSVIVLEQDGPSVLVRVICEAGTVEILGEIEWKDRRLTIERAHIGGLNPGALGRHGLNAIAQKFMEEADVDTLDIYGAARTTGRNPGRLPKPFRIIRQARASSR